MSLFQFHKVWFQLILIALILSKCCLSDEITETINTSEEVHVPEHPHLSEEEMAAAVGHEPELEMPEIPEDPNCFDPESTLKLMEWNLEVFKGQSVDIKLVDETINIIKGLKTDLVVVSMIGAYRTGKSFLLGTLVKNGYLTEDAVRPFKVGNTVHAQTEQIDVYIIPGCKNPIPNKPGTALLFLDSPGLFAPNRAAFFDSQLLALLNLASSAVMYNSNGPVDRNAIEKLSKAIENAFALSYYQEGDSFRLISKPHLIWVLQNVMLDMVDRGGNKISPTDYVVNVLNEMDQSNAHTTNFKYDFEKFFASMDAFLLPSPVALINDLKRLDSMGFDEIQDSYKTALTNLTHLITDISDIKKLGEGAVDGEILTHMLKLWCDSMNVPFENRNMQSSSEIFAKVQDNEFTKALEIYDGIMDSQITLPVSPKKLSHAHVDAEKQIIERVEHRVHSSTFTATLSTAISEKYEKTAAMNHGLIIGLGDSRRADLQKFMQENPGLKYPVLELSQIYKYVNDTMYKYKEDNIDLQEEYLASGDFKEHISTVSEVILKDQINENDMALQAVGLDLCAQAVEGFQKHYKEEKNKIQTNTFNINNILATCTSDALLESFVKYDPRDESLINIQKEECVKHGALNTENELKQKELEDFKANFDQIMEEVNLYKDHLMERCKVESLPVAPSFIKACHEKLNSEITAKTMEESISANALKALELTFTSFEQQNAEKALEICKHDVTQYSNLLDIDLTTYSNIYWLSETPPEVPKCQHESHQRHPDILQILDASHGQYFSVIEKRDTIINGLYILCYMISAVGIFDMLVTLKFVKNKIFFIILICATVINLVLGYRLVLLNPNNIPRLSIHFISTANLIFAMVKRPKEKNLKSIL